MLVWQMAVIYGVPDPCMRQVLKRAGLLIDPEDEILQPPAVLNQ